MIQSKKMALAAFIFLLTFLCLDARAALLGESAMLPVGRYELRSAVMEGFFELQGQEGAYRAFIHLTQKESEHTAELEGPARIEDKRLVMKSLADDGAELSMVFEGDRIVIRANDQAQMLYSGRNATFDGSYEYTPLGKRGTYRSTPGNMP
jgi:hypothetical protein